MSVDRLQERIRKVKNPIIVQFDLDRKLIPPHIVNEERQLLHAYGRYCLELLEGLTQIVSAVRFSFSPFAVLGVDGLALLSKLLGKAAQLGYYVILDVPEALTSQQAEANAEAFCGAGAQWKADSVVVSSYIGTDALKPYCSYIKDNKKSLFSVVRTGNKSAAELQDLLSGSRLAHMAQADFTNRLAEPYMGRSGYCRIGATVSATAGDSIRNLRDKYKYLFLLIDGFDYPGANGKNCSFAFDKLGHGAAVCVGSSITGAWLEGCPSGTDYVGCARNACERIKKNLLRYITIL